jgi:hypothetical protein
MINKRGELSVLEKPVTFIILNLIFLTAIFLFLSRTTTDSALEEQLEAKRIALMIDTMRPGTTITINLEELSEKAEKKGYRGPTIEIDTKISQVIIRLEEGEGYSHQYFTNIEQQNIRGDGRKKIEISLPQKNNDIN